MGVTLRAWAAGSPAGQWVYAEGALLFCALTLVPPVLPISPVPPGPYFLTARPACFCRETEPGVLLEASSTWKFQFA